MVRPLPDGGRGHPDRGDAGRHRLELGDLPRISRQCRTPAEGAQLRHVYRPFGAAHVRDGQARPRREGDRGRSARMAHAVARRCGPARWASRPRARRRMSRPDGTPVASRIADWEEIDRLVGAMAELDAGIFQIGPDISGGEAQRVFLERLRKVALDSGRPIMFGTLATKQGDRPEPVGLPARARSTRPSRAGGRMWGQATTRSINAIFSLKSYLPFDVSAGVARAPRAAARRAEGAAARSRGAARAWSPTKREMKPQATGVAGRRRGDDRSAQARLRQSVPDVRRRLGRPERRRAGAARATSTRSR